MQNWEEYFIKLNELMDEEGFDVSEESELSGEVWVRRQDRALAKWITSIASYGGIYFKFITPIQELYIYEPVFSNKKYPQSKFIFKTTNPPQGDSIYCYIIINDVESTNPIIIPENTNYLKIDDITDYLPQVQESNEGYLTQLKFTFGSNLVSQGTNTHIILI